MYGNNEVISYLQANNILALKLEYAVSAVGHQLAKQVEMIGRGLLGYFIIHPALPMNITMYANNRRPRIFASGMPLINSYATAMLSLIC